MTSSSKPDRLWILGMIGLAAGLVLRLAFLGADVGHPIWTGWITDEGRWTELAREWVLFGELTVESPVTRTHLVLAPLFQPVVAVAYLAFGVSTVAARLLSVVAGLGVLAFAWWFLRGRIGKGPAMFTVGLLALHPELVYFSRVAIPEMVALFFQLVAFAFLVGAPRTWRRAFLGGAALAVALGFKGTIAPVVLVFSVMVLATGAAGDPSSRWSRWVAFAGAIALPAVGFLLVLGIATGSVTAAWESHGSIGDILGFLELDSAYGALAVLYEGEPSIDVNLVLLAVWAIGAVSVLQGRARSEAWSVGVGAAVWAVGWIAVWAVLLYFPERYVVHVHLPLVLAIGAGVAVLSDPQVSASALRESIEGLSGRTRRWITGWALSLPAAFAAAPAVAAASRASGLPVEGLIDHVVVTFAVGAIAATALVRFWSARTVVAGTLAFPLTVAAGAMVAEFLGALPGLHWAGGLEVVPTWVALLLLGALVARSMVLRGGGEVSSAARRLVVVYLSVVAVVWVADGADRLAQRAYVAGEIREFLSTRYPPGLEIGVDGGASVLIDSEYRMHVMTGDELREVMILVEGRGVFLDIPTHQEVAAFPLPVGPRHYFETPFIDHVRVFERVPGREGAAPFSSETP